MENSDVIIYTTPFCGYCSAAKSLLQSKGVEYFEIDVSTDKALREEMMEKSGRRTVPQIFIKGEHIGGFDDMNALEQAGDLDPRLGL